MQEGIAHTHCELQKREAEQMLVEAMSFHFFFGGR